MYYKPSIYFIYGSSVFSHLQKWIKLQHLHLYTSWAVIKFFIWFVFYFIFLTLFFTSKEVGFGGPTGRVWMIKLMPWLTINLFFSQTTMRSFGQTRSSKLDGMNKISIKLWGYIFNIIFFLFHSFEMCLYEHFSGEACTRSSQSRIREKPWSTNIIWIFGRWTLLSRLPAGDHTQLNFFY